jgi:P pilus assembly chaperone PapD
MLSPYKCQIYAYVSENRNSHIKLFYGPQSIKGQMAEIIKLLALKDGDGYYLERR